MAKNGPIRDQRRQELIQATIAVIARHGYSGTTVARVARKAGVSTGLMNFHFDSKDRLFRATFDFLAAEYQEVWDRNLAAAGIAQLVDPNGPPDNQTTPPPPPALRRPSGYHIGVRIPLP